MRWYPDLTFHDPPPPGVPIQQHYVARHMPALEAFFLYRNLDVSTLKELAKRWKPAIMAGLTKHGKHEALADIRESIEELKYYREHFLKL